MVSEQRPKPLRSWMAADAGGGHGGLSSLCRDRCKQGIFHVIIDHPPPQRKKKRPHGADFSAAAPARYRNFRVYNLSPMRYNVRVCLGLLSKQRQTAPPLISAGMMELVDMRDLGSRASPRWGSSPHARTTSPRTTYRSRRLFYKSHLSLILSRLLSKPDRYRWAPVWVRRCAAALSALKNIDFSRPFHTNIIRTCFR